MTRKIHRGGFVAAAVVAGAFGWFMASHFVDFPVGDDFRAIFTPAVAVKNDGWEALSFENLAAQHHSHRIVAVRIIAAVQTLLFGGVNFVAFMWCGLLMWLLVFGLLGAKEGWFVSVAPALTAALVWFQPQAASNLQVAMQAVQNIGVVLLAVVAFGLRARLTLHATVGAWLCALFAWFTAGNGMLVPLILVLWSALERNWRQAAVGTLATAVAGALYFRGFENPEGQAYGFDVLQLAGNFFVMLGSVFRFGTLPISAALTGGALLAVSALWLLWVRFRERKNFSVAVLFFVFGSAAMASLARLGWGIEYMAQGRYRIYAVILLALVLTEGVRRLATKPVVSALVAGFALVFSLASWWQFAPEVVNAARTAKASAMSYHLGVPALFSESDETLRSGLNRLTTAIEAGLYSPPMQGEARQLERAQHETIPASDIRAEYSQAVAGWVVRPQNDKAGEYLLCRTPGSSGFRVAVRATRRPALTRMLGKNAGGNIENVYLMPRSVEDGTASDMEFFAIR